MVTKFKNTSPSHVNDGDPLSNIKPNVQEIQLTSTCIKNSQFLTLACSLLFQRRLMLLTGVSKRPEIVEWWWSERLKVSQKGGGFMVFALLVVFCYP